MATKVFINLPVNDLVKSRAFFTKLGYSVNEQFSDENAACLVISDSIFCMLLIEKEPLEISFRYDTASVKYAHFLRSHPALEDRLKQHEIASYLGITPTQLSRIRSQK